ncbi:MAG: signal peptidase I, partial [Planctomycetota bacterium]|nr:signal peptidase I [Planctomycetota bacterium]
MPPDPPHQPAEARSEDAKPLHTDASSPAAASGSGAPLPPPVQKAKQFVGAADSRKIRALLIEFGDRFRQWGERITQPVSTIRPVVEIAVALLLLVVLFRAFLAGGYMIETGSMAPCLFGYHKRAECPACHYPFAVDGTLGSETAVCPNCGEDEIDVDPLLLNDGDHLLVSRPSFEFADPRRWNVIVFANPSKPGQAYVKRLAGLPGESIRIKWGDLYVGGKIQQKDLETQRSMRILVHDHAYQPPASDPDWQPRWVIDPPRAGWSERSQRFIFAPPKGSVKSTAEDHEIREWVSYRHWIRSGGDHHTSVQLVDWPAALSPGLLQGTQLTYVDSNRTLICRGVLDRGLRDRLEREAASAAFRQSLGSLSDASHVAPIRDVYGYNHTSERGAGNKIRDLMFSATVALRGEPGVFAISMTDGVLACRCEFDTARQEIRLINEQTTEELRKAPLPPGLTEGALVEMSVWDRQVLVAVSGVLPFEPFVGPSSPGRGQTPWQPVKFGAR